MNSEPFDQDDHEPGLDLSIYGTQLLFDDEPLPCDEVRRDEEQTTHDACALEQWKSGENRTTECARAVVAIITHNARYADELEGTTELEPVITETIQQETNEGRADGEVAARCHAALGALCHNKSEIDEAISSYKRAIKIYCKQEVIEGFDIVFVLRQMTELLNRIGQGQQARRYKRRLMVARAEHVGDIHGLRGIALQMYEDGDLEEAETVYQKMVHHRHELASTFCHVVRIKILMNRIPEAKADVDRAMYEWREENYILARILFFRVLFAMLDGKDYTWFLQQIKATCESGGATLNWLMEPVIEFLENQMDREEWNLLQSIHSVLSDKEELRSLRAHRIWTEAVGDPFEPNASEDTEDDDGYDQYIIQLEE